ncbi:MAG: nitroreductase family protein [Bacteroidota bacterium]|nr:nitroreductase family protein [Bacteroidota bacterium]
MEPEQLLELFSRRQSVRAYDSSKPVEAEKLLRCIEAARIAPSACNAQPWKFIVVDNPELKNKLADLTSSKLLSMNHFTKQAPVHVVVVREKANFTSTVGQVLKDKEYPLIDIGIATIQFCLQATVEGVGTCILGWFDEKGVRKLLNIPRNKRVELVITVGYAASDEIRRKIRKDTSEILSFNGY